MSRKYVSQAIRRLVGYGYLDRGPRVTEPDGSVREHTFRLVHALPRAPRPGRVSPRHPSQVVEASPPGD
jgi:hypothetical protein